MMIPPANSYMPPIGNRGMAVPTNELTQQMQGMRVCPSNQGSRMPLNQPPGFNQQWQASNQPPGVIPPQQNHRGSSTSVTYSGPPRATYPYNNNAAPNTPTSSMNNNNHVQYNANVQGGYGISPQDLKMGSRNVPNSMYSPPPPVANHQNGISNGHDDTKFRKEEISTMPLLQQPPLSPPQRSQPQSLPPQTAQLPVSQPQMSQAYQPTFTPMQQPQQQSFRPILPSSTIQGQQQYSYPTSSPQQQPFPPPPLQNAQMAPNPNQMHNSNMPSMQQSSYQAPPPPIQNAQMGPNLNQMQNSNMSSSQQSSYQAAPPPIQNAQMGPNLNQMQNSNMSSSQQSSYQAGLPNMGLPSSPTYPQPGSPPAQYPGMPLPPPPSGPGMPSQQYPGSPGARYPYSPSQAQGMQPPPPSLDLDQMPSLVQVREEDKRVRGGYFSTDVKDIAPPLVTTDFIAQDRGMSSPRFIRSTLYCLPNQPDVLKQTAVPFALTICPMANTVEGENPPALSLYREEGPLRCKRCKAYICPFMTFMEGGRCFQCAFCKVVTEVPQDYFCFLDGIGERTDKYHRPELCLGSYEYMATKEYCRNDQMPNPPAYIFMIEVSNASFRNGLVPLLCENMKHILQTLKNDEQNDTSKLRIGFVTYNNVLHFYNMKKNLTQPHIMVLSDVHNAFVPLLEGFLVTLDEAEALVDCLMDHIPRLFMNEPASEVILGPVIQVGLEALKNANCSGKLFVFHSTIPNADAPGKLQHREGQKLLGTDKQKTILGPQHDFYSKLAQDCVAAGCAVDLFLFPNAYIDIATISPLCRHTGGQIYKYTYFQSHVDGDRFLEDLEKNLVTPTAFDAVLRVRTSAGISPIFYYGNFFMSNTTDVELSAIDNNKCITIELAYDDKLPENETVHVQAALLYTTITGERKIRVHNLALATSVGMPDVFKCCELDTIINFFAKQALKQLLEHSPQQVKSTLVSRSVKILACYRKHCASASSTGQLILPDQLKLLPLYINCLLKSDAIGGGSDMSLDDRSFAMLAVNSMDVKSTAMYFYPTLIPIHNVDPDSDDIPTPIRCSIEKLNDNGAYLLENGIYMFLWIGQAISPEWLQNVFGVQSTNQVDKQKSSLPELDTPLSRRIRNIVEDLEEGRQWYMRLTVMVQGDKLEVVFRQFLVEDRGTDGSSSYVDFICHVHNEIAKSV